AEIIQRVLGERCREEKTFLGVKRAIDKERLSLLAMPQADRPIVPPCVEDGRVGGRHPAAAVWPIAAVNVGAHIDRPPGLYAEAGDEMPTAYLPVVDSE